MISWWNEALEILGASYYLWVLRVCFREEAIDMADTEMTTGKPQIWTWPKLLGNLFLASTLGLIFAPDLAHKRQKKLDQGSRSAGFIASLLSGSFRHRKSKDEKIKLLERRTAELEAELEIGARG